MKTLIKRIIYESRSDVFRMVPLMDIHAGNAACDEKLLRETVADIASDPFTFWVGGGDMAEYINRKDPRYEAESEASWLWGRGDIAKAEREWLLDTLAPIAPQCKGLLTGNHEDSILHHQERDVYASVCEGMAQRLPKDDQGLMLGFSGFLRLIFLRGDSPRANAWTVDLFLTHGWWAGRLYGNGELNLERVFGWVDADMVLAGHDHKRRAFGISKVRPKKNGTVEQVDGFCCSGGSFLGRAGYAEKRGYRPLPVGPLEIYFTPDKHRINVKQ